MNDEQLGPVVSSWLKQEKRPPSDPTASVQTAMNAATKTRQLRRWWWLPPFVHRLPHPPSRPHAVDHTTEYQPSPIPASNGHTPTVIGRTQSMLSPVKAITAGAIVAAVGGAFLIAQPFQQQGSVPGAEVQPPPAPTAFSATYFWSDRSNPGSTTEYDDGTIVSVGQGWMFDSRESSDPRFAGPLVLTVTDITYPDVVGGLSVGGYRIETDEGAWQQVPGATPWYEEGSALWASGELPPPDNIQFYTFIGEGGYEGLTAVVQETWFPGGAEGLVQFDGSIFEGDLPAAPEPWVP